MSSFLIGFGGRDNGGSVQDYKKAGKKAKKAIAMIMDGIENGDASMVEEGAEDAWKSVKTMCEISDDMAHQYGERRYDGMYNRGSGEGSNFRGNDAWGQRHDRNMPNYRHDDDWNERDDEWMERRMSRFTRR